MDCLCARTVCIQLPPFLLVVAHCYLNITKMFSVCMKNICNQYNQYFFNPSLSLFTKICKYLVLIIRSHTKLLMRKSLFMKNICTKTFANYRNVAILYSSSYVSWWRHYHVTRTNEMIFENSLPRSP